MIAGRSTYERVGRRFDVGGKLCAPSLARLSVRKAWRQLFALAATVASRPGLSCDRLSLVPPPSSASPKRHYLREGDLARGRAKLSAQRHGEIHAPFRSQILGTASIRITARGDPVCVPMRRVAGDLVAIRRGGEASARRKGCSACGRGEAQYLSGRGVLVLRR